jgi:hypothetical protein
MPYAEKLDDLHGRPMINIVSGATFYIYDKYSSTLSKPSGWLSLKTMEDAIIFCPEPNPIFALRMAVHAPARQLAYLCAGISSQVSSITSAERPDRAVTSEDESARGSASRLRASSAPGRELRYSFRRAMTGSTFIARRAGR